MWGVFGKPQAIPFGSCEEQGESREMEHRKYNWVMEGLGYWVKEFGLIFDNKKLF